MMLARLVLFIVLGIFVARAFWRLIDGIAAGMRGGPARGVQMVRDPVCGTFVLPDHALMITDGRARVFFCSDACRDKYRLSTGPWRPEGHEGRARRG